MEGDFCVGSISLHRKGGALLHYIIFYVLLLFPYVKDFTAMRTSIT